MNILFFGTPLFAKNILENLLNDKYFNIIGLVTQIDKPFGRKKELKAPQTKEFLESIKSDIPIFQHINLNDTKFVYDLNPDIILVVAYGNLIPKDIIDNFNCINIHASILPKSRGASPIQDMILRNDRFFGISIMKMSHKLDDGDILGIRYIENPRLDIDEATSLLSIISSAFIIKILKEIDYITPLPQFHVDSSYCKKIKKTDGEIDFINAFEIYLKYLAYKSWPNIFLKNGTKLFSIDINELDSTNKKGEILKINKDSIIIGCLKGSLIVKELQDTGKNKVNASVYLLGKRLKAGDVLNGN
ncbi:methionyl-tRNA formyltransferase [Helicobacter sp. MIT 99-5507]|uniref:methionyl-tRNA formyltransferase n=1 Tax=Helicobacter sp. MIT 99-5507 TaxID=152489 RepID=UPI000E1F4CBE|nr:methionyl-tRNA formyltransferase [Helicobacter sp. MIT 99-5507]RDU58397.1 methionyl-tRNA formyltransferase [Helicobacter sp. MIT 99-5507]